jgi:hypothetical protein
MEAKDDIVQDLETGGTIPRAILLRITAIMAAAMVTVSMATSPLPFLVAVPAHPLPRAVTTLWGTFSRRF